MLDMVSMYLNEIVRSDNLWEAHVYIEAVTSMFEDGGAYGDVYLAVYPAIARVEEADSHEECIEAAQDALRAIEGHSEAIGCPDED